MIEMNIKIKNWEIDKKKKRIDKIYSLFFFYYYYLYMKLLFILVNVNYQYIHILIICHLYI